MKVLDDGSDIFVGQRIEIGHLRSMSDAAGLCDKAVKQARIPILRYVARTIQFGAECPSHAVDRVAFQAISDEKLLSGLRRPVASPAKASDEETSSIATIW